MPAWDPTTARCSVFVKKEGLLSAVGHDVRLEVRRFRVELEDDGVVASFDTTSVVAVCATRDGRDTLGTLSAKDLGTIDGYVQADILESKRHPAASFRSADLDVTDGEGTVTGTLQLHGVSRTVTGKVTTVDGKTVVRVRLSQPEFGIKPFRAMLGALKIQPNVDVELTLPSLVG